MLHFLHWHDVCLLPPCRDEAFAHRCVVDGAHWTGEVTGEVAQQPVGQSVWSWGLVYADLSQLPFHVRQADDEVVRDDVWQW